MIPETSKTNEVNPTVMAPSFCQEIISGPQCRMENKIYTGNRCQVQGGGTS